MWTAIFLIQNLDFIAILAFDTQEKVVMETKTGTNKCRTENRANPFDFTTPKSLNLHSKRWKTETKNQKEREREEQKKGG